MRLKYDRQVRNKNITLEIEAVEFSDKEVSALKRLGEPVIKLEKVYGEQFGVNIERRLGQNFKIKTRFDGTENIELAIGATNDFLEDLQLIVEDQMRVVMDENYMIQSDFDNKKGYLDVSY